MEFNLMASEPNTVLVGFGSADLNAALPSDRPVRDEIQVNVVFLRQGNLACCWAVLDFMDFDRLAITQIKNTVATECRLAVEHIHLLTTHNHGAGEVEILNIAVIAAATVTAVKTGMATAVPARLRYGQAIIPEPLNYLRRQEVEMLGGCSTFFFGPCAANGFNGAEFLQYQLDRLQTRHEMVYCGRSESAASAVSCFPPIDLRMRPGYRTVAALLFERDDGTVIGTICRYAAHAVCCNRPEYYSSDYPLQVRRYITAQLGGITVFMNGPCAEIAPAIPDKNSGGEVYLGERIGRAAVAMLRECPLQPLTFLADRSDEVVLPIRPDLPTVEEASSERKRLAEKLASGRNLSLPEIKIIAERINFLNTADFLRKKWQNGEAEKTLCQRQIAGRIGRLTLNNITVLALPGETFSATAETIRNRAELPALITVTEHDRTLMYLVPEKEYTRGGYETTCCLAAFRAESILIDAVVAFLRR